MSKFCTEPLNSNDDFCESYEELWDLVVQEDPGRDIRGQVTKLIEVLAHYLSGLKGVIGGFNLNCIVQSHGLPSLEIRYRSGNLRYSLTLEELQEQFSLNGKARDSTSRHSGALSKSESISSSSSGKEPPSSKSSIKDSRQPIKPRRKSKGETSSCVTNKSL